LSLFRSHSSLAHQRSTKIEKEKNTPQFLPNQRNSRISYRSFWKNFSPENFYLDKLLKEHTSGKIVVQSVYPGTLAALWSRIFRWLNSKAGPKPPRRENIIGRLSGKRIWWTGENRRPPVDDEYSLFVSFDQDSFSGKNITFPIIWDTILFPDVYFLSRVGIDSLDPNSLLMSRSPGTPTEFCCTFINNPEPIRLRGIQALSKHGKVDVFGSQSKRPVKTKIEVASRYKFVMCFENDLYPGYITEKLLDAYLCGAVPLYWGDLGDEPHINREAFINAKDFDSLEEFASFVGNLSEESYNKIHSQPLLNSLPSSEKLIQALRNL